MGAWIEIMEVKELEEDDESHPLWVRGLKLFDSYNKQINI